eukprot:1136508-Pelagomonas_calceolata.AAC.1
MQFSTAAFALVTCCCRPKQLEWGEAYSTLARASCLNFGMHMHNIKCTSSYGIEAGGLGYPFDRPAIPVGIAGLSRGARPNAGPAGKQAPLLFLGNATSMQRAISRIRIPHPHLLAAGRGQHYLSTFSLHHSLNCFILLFTCIAPHCKDASSLPPHMRCRSQNMHEYWRSLQGTEHRSAAFVRLRSIMIFFFSAHTVQCKQWQFAEEDGAVKAYNGRMDGADAVCRH